MKTINLDNLNINQITDIFGKNDENIKYIENSFDCKIILNNNELVIEKDNDKIINILTKLIEYAKSNEEISLTLIDQLIKNNMSFDKSECFVTCYNGKVIKPLNYSQYNYLKLLQNNVITFATGVAGSGKTYLAVAFAINLLKSKKIDKIVITRPIVEAGENLGFLPGEIKEKVDPYLIPIYDSLYDILGKENTDKYLERETIEIAPLAYMRGRTLNNSFIILDEAQNTTTMQMKMFLTRLGNNSYMAITGDETQIDLKDKTKSGIVDACHLLYDIEEIGIIKFDSKDVVRNPLVAKIIDAYNKKESI